MADNPYLPIAESLTPPQPGGPGPNAGNPYADMLDRALGGAQQRVRAAATLAIEDNPDEIARQRRIASILNVPPPAVAAWPTELEREARIRGIQQQTAQAPATQRAMGDVEFAKVAHDDVENLSAVEGALRSMKSAAEYLFSAGGKRTLIGDVKAGFYDANRGAAGLFQAPLELAAPLVDPLVGRLLPENPLRRAAAAFAATGKWSKQQADALSPPTDSILQGGFSSGVRSFTGNALTLPLAFLPGGQAAALYGMSAQTGGTAYQQARDAGYGPGGALPFAASQALVEYWTEKIPLDALIGDVKAGSSFLRTLMNQAAKEVPGEQVATLLQDLNEWAVLNPEKPFSEYLAARPAAAAQTLIATLVGTGGNVALMKSIDAAMTGADERAARAQVAEENARVIEQLNALAAASKVAQRDPASFEQFVEQAAADGPVTDVYVSAEVLNQSGLGEALAQVSPAVREQLAAASATGGDVRIPIGEYAARIAPSEYGQALLDHLKTDPAGFSRAEAADFIATQTEELKAEVERAVAAQQDQAAYRALVDEVKARVRTELDAAGRFTAPVNEAYSTMVSSFFATMGAKLGVSPVELFDRYRLTVRDRTLQDAAQPVLDQQGQSLDTVRQAWSQAGIDATLSESGDVVTVSKIVVPADRRGQGVGTQAMQQLVEWADANGKHLALSPSADFGGSKRRLQAFYKRFGFVPNTGKNRAFTVSESMVRPAQGKVLEQAGRSQDGSVALRALADEGNDQAILAQALVDRLRLSPEQLADVLEGVALGAQPDGLVGVPPLAAVLAEMRRAVLDDPKVLDAIVGSVPVDVVNDLAGSQSAAKVLLHDQAMLEDSAAFNADLPVAEGVDAAGTVRLLVGEAARRAAEVTRRALGARRESGEASAAVSAGQGERLGQGGTSARATFNPSTNTITLLQGADLSSFLHESGHFFLEVQFGIAAELQKRQAAGETLTDGEQDILRDTAELLRWFGVADLQEWFTRPFEERVGAHEQFARGFERYLMEGKAPSIELQSLFQRFRSWLVNVYRQLKNLNVDLTPEVRGVFDRMLATQEQIALAEKAGSMMPLFATPEAGGMTVDEFARYQALGTEATAAAIDELQARSMKDMQWVEAARGREIERLKKANEALRTEMRMQVRNEVMAAPIYRAWQFLTSKLDTEGLAGRLDRDALAEMYGGTGDGRYSQYALLDWKALQDRGMTAAEGGLHPDVVAEMHGIDSGDAMVKALLTAPDPKTMIETLTDQRMLEAYGDLNSEEALAEAANRAVHNEARARFLAAEARALEKASGPTRDAGTDARGRPRRVAILPEAARAIAAQIIARQRIRDIRPGQYTAAEARAARAAEKAHGSGDLALAAAEKRNQIVNLHTARAAQDALAEVEAGRRYLRKFDSEGTRKGLSTDYLDQIDALLERFDLRRISNKAADRRLGLQRWIETQRDQGLEPDIPEALIDEAFRRPVRELTVEEFRGLVDAVKQIEHLGRLKNRLLLARDQRAYEAIRDEIATSIVENAGDRQASARTATTWAGRKLAAVRRFVAEHVKVATLAAVMDGGKDGGPVWEHFIRTANERGDMETTMRAAATQRLTEILKPVLEAGRMGGKGTHFPTIGRSLNRQERIAIALNWGNEGNRQRLLGGEGWTAAQVMPVLQSLTAAEWRAVQGVWDYLDSFRPAIGEKEMRVYGKEPEWIEPAPFAMRSSDGTELQMKGGYYPIVYDPAASQRAEEHSDAEGAKRQLQGAYTTATTRRSFTKARVEEVVGRPLLYDLSGVYRGVNDVIHDLAWHEWLIDTNRLLRSQTIDAAIREHYGPDAKAQFKTWAADIAEGDKSAQTAGEVASAWLRRSVSAAGLGFNLTSAAMQILGFNQSIVRVGAGWMGRGIGRFIGSPIDSARMVAEKSEFMRNRARTRFREIAELRNRVEDQSGAMRVVHEHAYTFLMGMQKMVDIPTWIAGYEKAIAGGASEADAIALADQGVIDAQGGGQTKDLSRIERGGPLQKLFTVFYSFMNTAFNLGARQAMLADTPAKKAKLAVDFLMLYSVPAVLGGALKAALTPGGDDEWDWEALARKLAAEQISYLMGLMVYTREAQSLAQIVTGAEGARFGYQGPAGLRFFSDLTNLATQAAQGEFDPAFRKALINVIGDMTGLPSAQINRMITGAEALAEGETENPAALVFGYQQ